MQTRDALALIRSKGVEIYGSGPNPAALHRTSALWIAEGIAQTANEYCLFYFWVGHNFGHANDAVYLGHVMKAAEFVPWGRGEYQPPDIWWSTDRRWCVVVYTDSPSAYVAGPVALIEMLCADERLDALPASPTDLMDDWTSVVTAD